MILEQRKVEAEAPKHLEVITEQEAIQEPRCIKPSATIVTNEFKGIKSLDLLSKAANMLEKLIWGVVFIFGMFWASYFLIYETQSWQGAPSVIRWQNLNLSEIQSPAITFCSQTSTKFAIAEQLGNYLNADYGLPDQFLEIREVLLKYMLEGSSFTGVAKSIGDMAQCPKFDCKVK